jgi:uncharacterized protein (UPF0218 family)
MLRLPRELRSAFKDPLGPLYEDPEHLLVDAGTPVVAVGDVVTYHLNRVGRVPDVAIIDGQTKREAVGETVREATADPETRFEAVNEAGVISEDLLITLRRALADPDPVTIVVDGEEDLATLPAIVAAPVGASVVYGQPDEGMVLVDVTEARREELRALMRRMEGDVDAAFEALGVES